MKAHPAGRRASAEAAKRCASAGLDGTDVPSDHSQETKCTRADAVRLIKSKISFLLPVPSNPQPVSPHQCPHAAVASKGAVLNSFVCHRGPPPGDEHFHTLGRHSKRGGPAICLVATRRAPLVDEARVDVVRLGRVAACDKRCDTEHSDFRRHPGAPLTSSVGPRCRGTATAPEKEDRRRHPTGPARGLGSASGQTIAAGGVGIPPRARGGGPKPLTGGMACAYPEPGPRVPLSPPKNCDHAPVPERRPCWRLITNVWQLRQDPRARAAA